MITSNIDTIILSIVFTSAIFFISYLVVYNPLKNEKNNEKNNISNIFK